MIDIGPLSPPSTSSPAAPSPADARLRDSARRLEAAFLAEMLKSAGVGDPPSSFGGGTGEAQFASFQRELLADQLVTSGGIGLAERIFTSLKARQDGA